MQMINPTGFVHRSVYRAQALPNKAGLAAAGFQNALAAFMTGLNSGEVMTASAFQSGASFYLYWESVQYAIEPDTLFGEVLLHLETWPGEAAPRQFVPMMDIFHGMPALNVAQWQRRQPIQRVQGRLARLRPEQVSSYIFYHYQLQEERPGSFDKYGLISMHENVLFYYQELPAVVELPAPAGKLRTANTPDNWHEVMLPHFNLWDDAPAGQEIWRDINLIGHVSCWDAV
jgi:hypothetical protein